MKTIPRLLGWPITRSALLGVLALVLWGQPAGAVTITGIMAPDLQRPKNGVLYPFTILVSGTYGPLDLDPNDPPVLSIQYWDQDRFIFDFLDPDDPIHTTPTLNVPPAPGAAVPGTAWGPISVDFRVGCDEDEVIGPAGVTGEDPMDDGYFHIPDARNKNWGYNTVTCIASSGQPTSGEPRALRQLSDVPDHPDPVIPEPSSLLLLGAGFLGVGFLRRRFTF